MQTKLKVAAIPLLGGVVEVGEMTELLYQVLKSAIAHPVGYWSVVREQMYDILRMCWIPMSISTVVFGFGAPGLQGGNIFLLFGIPERLGAFFLVASVREFAPWIEAMVIAGVIGTAITADLGARRIRDEFDAMEIMGVDPIRDVILPRVVAVTIMTGLFDIVALSLGVVGGWLADVEIGANSYAYFNSFWANSTVTDVVGSVTKTFIFGLFIGIVCCYKGYRAKGGPIGVGRAVNQAVVISFAAIWAFNSAFTQIMLGLNPYIEVYR